MLTPSYAPARRRDVGGPAAGLVGEEGDLDPLAHPARLVQHRRRHGLLDQLDPAGHQPLDLANRGLLVLPALVGVHPQGLVGDGSDRGDGGLVAVEPDLDLEHRKGRRLLDLPPGHLRGVDPDGEGGEGAPRRGRGRRGDRGGSPGVCPIQSWSAMSRAARAAYWLSRRGKAAARRLSSAQGSAASTRSRTPSRAATARTGVLVVAHDGGALSEALDPVAPVAGQHRLAVLAGGHGGRPGVPKVQAEALHAEPGSGGHGLGPCPERDEGGRGGGDAGRLEPVPAPHGVSLLPLPGGAGRA